MPPGLRPPGVVASLISSSLPQPSGSIPARPEAALFGVLGAGVDACDDDVLPEPGRHRLDGACGGDHRLGEVEFGVEPLAGRVAGDAGGGDEPGGLFGLDGAVLARGLRQRPPRNRLLLRGCGELVVGVVGVVGLVGAALHAGAVAAVDEGVDGAVRHQAGIRVIPVACVVVSAVVVALFAQLGGLGGESRAWTSASFSAALAARSPVDRLAGLEDLVDAEHVLDAAFELGVGGFLRFAWRDELERFRRGVFAERGGDLVDRGEVLGFQLFELVVEEVRRGSRVDR